MTYTVQPVNIDTDNWGDLINKLNDLIGGAANNFVTIGAEDNNGNLVINGDLQVDSVNTVAVTTNTATVNVANFGSLTSNTANVRTITSNTIVVNSANVSTITVSTGNFTSISSNTISTSNVSVSNTATVNILVANNTTLTSANVETLNANNLIVVTENVTTITANTSNINRLNANTANVASLYFSTRIEGNVSNFILYGGTVTAKFLKTDGAGNLSFYYPQLSDMSDFNSYSANVANTISQLETNTNNRITQVEANALAFAIALG